MLIGNFKEKVETQKSKNGAKLGCSRSSPFHFGFTLAEVLITLGIIGVVAAMTIPTLIANTVKTQYVTALKKGYSSIQQGFKMYLANQDSQSLGDTDLFDGVTNFSTPARRIMVDSIIKKYFNVAKSCVSSDSSCDMKGTYLKATGSAVYQTNSFYIFKTTGGMSVAISLGTTCQPDYSVIGNMKAFCGTIVMDVNGDKLPNVLGRDIYSFALGHDGVLHPSNGSEFAKYWQGVNWVTSASYWRNDSSLCGVAGSSTLSGTINGYCAARIMEEGWDMQY